MAKYKYKLTDGNGDDLLPIPTTEAEAANWRTALNLDMEAYRIPNETDLNAITTPGVYFSPTTNATVGTLVNCPVSTPFVMLVSGSYTGSTAGCVQAIMSESAIYTRRGTSSGFGSWYKFEGTRMT